MLEGWDADWCAGYARVDYKIYVNEIGERRARINGRNTYDLRSLDGKTWLDYRHEDHVEGRPPTESNLVCTSHVCNLMLPVWGIYTPPNKKSVRKKIKPPF